VSRVFGDNGLVGRARRKLYERFAPQRLTWEERYRPKSAIRGWGRFEAGNRTYWFRGCDFAAWKPEDSIEIGAYCSIAKGAMLQAGGNHDVEAISTYPFSMIDRWEGVTGESQPIQHLRIGNDVWIGANAMVLGDIEIGDGAVIGAGAVVVRDVPPYAVVAGVPARVLRERFAPDEVARLRELRWWDWPERDVLDAEALLRAADIPALEQFAASRSLPRAAGTPRPAAHFRADPPAVAEEPQA